MQTEDWQSALDCVHPQPMARILVIEDNAAHRERMSYLLTSLGHVVLAARNGAEGEAVVHIRRPDLIVCGLGCNALDAFEVARRLKNNRAVSKTTLVAITAFDSVFGRDRALAAGFDDYLAKPIEPEAFAEQVEAWLGDSSERWPKHFSRPTAAVAEFAKTSPLEIVARVSENIAEQERTEDLLSESRQRFQAIFENSLDGILLVDDRGSFVDANPAICRLLGYDREELLQRTVWDLTPVSNRSRPPKLLRWFLSEGTLSGEYTLLRKDGATRETEYCSVANIFHGLHLAIYRDVTEQKRAERALRDSEE